MKIASWVTPEGLAGHGLSTTGIDDGQRFFLDLALIVLTCCERLGNVGYWSFTSIKIAVKQGSANPKRRSIAGDS